ncbi:uncharacterized protein LOC124278516 [Haliotis rubra]|uniref:uncharacterized protein LOC124278516 n=1 Tax=Haliotis rubra TaxID=36100 RepID=UPI001EE5AD41|nr:uncharacterized protein LOC124278516 [Haliotis rubra]
MKDKSYRVQIELNDLYGTDVTRCDCPMGNFYCHHVAAVLLFGYKRASKTDVKCSWLKKPKSKMRADTATMEDLFPPRKPGYRALNREVTQEDRDQLCSELEKLGRFTGY